MNFKFTMFDELELEVVVDRYEPDSPPPYASTPNSPNWADPGEDEIMKYLLFFIYQKGKVKHHILVPDELYPYFKDKVEDQIRSQAKDEEEYRAGRG